MKCILAKKRNEGQKEGKKEGNKRGRKEGRIKRRKENKKVHPAETQHFDCCWASEEAPSVGNDLEQAPSVFA